MTGFQKKVFGAAVLAAVLAVSGGGCASFQPIPGPGRDGGLYRYTADYADEELPFALCGKALIIKANHNWALIPLALFPGFPLYAVERYVLCPVVDTALVPYDLALKLWEGHVCAHKGLKVVLVDGAERPVPGCEIAVSADAFSGRRIVYGGKPCPPGYFATCVTTDGNGEAYVPIDMGTCETVRIKGRARTMDGEEDFRAQARGGWDWASERLDNLEKTGDPNRIVIKLKGIVGDGKDSGNSAQEAGRVPAWKTAMFAGDGVAEARTPPVPEGVRSVVLPTGKGRWKVSPERGGAASVGVGIDPMDRDTVVWNAAGTELWRHHAKRLSMMSAQLPAGTWGWNGRDVMAAPRPMAGVLAWDGPDVAIRPKGWKKGAKVDVFAWSLEGYGEELAQRIGEAVDCGTNAVCFEAEADGGWWRVRWDAWPDAPDGDFRFYALAVREDSDGDGLDDGREVILLHTDPTRCDTDGDTRSDGLEVDVLGSNPLQSFLDTSLAVNAFWADPDGAGGSWVELRSSAPRGIPLQGFRLETAKDGAWRTVLVFPDGLSMPPGGPLLIGERGVAGADLHADLDFPPRWPSQPLAGVRLVRNGAAGGSVADAVIVGRGGFPEKGGLDRAGWDSHAGVRPKGAEPLVRHRPDVDNNRSRDWTTRAGYAGRSAKVPLDSDGDGLSDADERSGRLNQPWGEPTNPFSPDSDGDGLGDFEECCIHHTNPGKWDTDGDIWPWGRQGAPAREWPGSDPWEIEHGWNPLVADENANGIPDGQEMALGAAAVAGPDADSDGDGIPAP